MSFYNSTHQLTIITKIFWYTVMVFPLASFLIVNSDDAILESI